MPECVMDGFCLCRGWCCTFSFELVSQWFPFLYFGFLYKVSEKFGEWLPRDEFIYRIRLLSLSIWFQRSWSCSRKFSGCLWCFKLFQRSMEYGGISKIVSLEAGNILSVSAISWYYVRKSWIVSLFWFVRDIYLVLLSMDVRSFVPNQT